MHFHNCTNKSEQGLPAVLSRLRWLGFTFALSVCAICMLTNLFDLCKSAPVIVGIINFSGNAAVWIQAVYFVSLWGCRV